MDTLKLLRGGSLQDLLAVDLECKGAEEDKDNSGRPAHRIRLMVHPFTEKQRLE